MSTTLVQSLNYFHFCSQGYCFALPSICSPSALLFILLPVTWLCLGTHRCTLAHWSVSKELHNLTMSSRHVSFFCYLFHLQMFMIQDPFMSMKVITSNVPKSRTYHTISHHYYACFTVSLRSYFLSISSGLF